MFCYKVIIKSGYVLCRRQHSYVWKEQEIDSTICLAVRNSFFLSYIIFLIHWGDFFEFCLLISGTILNLILKVHIII